MKTYANKKKPLLQREQQKILISFDEEKQVNESGKTIGYSYETVWVSFPYDKGMIVSAIIKDKYSDDQMTAIINNHLLEANDEEHEAEYIAMQAWRVKAKEVATLVMSKPIPN